MRQCLSHVAFNLSHEYNGNKFFDNGTPGAHIEGYCARSGCIILVDLLKNKKENYEQQKISGGMSRYSRDVYNLVSLLGDGGPGITVKHMTAKKPATKKKVPGRAAGGKKTFRLYGSKHMSKLAKRMHKLRKQNATK